MSQALQVQSAAAVLADIEKSVGGRRAILQALVTAPQSRDIKYLIGLLADPDRRTQSLAAICLEAKIVPGTLLDMLERGTKLQSRIIAGQIIARGTPAMVEDVMAKAAPFHDDCTDCQGTGTHVPDPTPEVPNPNPEQCTVCRGTGKLRYEADPECRRLGLEIAGLTAKGGGVTINNTNQLNAPQVSVGLAFEALQELQDRLVYGHGAPPVTSVDGTIVVPPQESSPEESSHA